MTPQAIWAAEYSTEQGAYHIDTMDKVIQSNLSLVQAGKCNGFAVIGIFDTYDEASRFVALHRQYTELENLAVSATGKLKH